MTSWLPLVKLFCLSCCCCLSSSAGFKHSALSYVRLPWQDVWSPKDPDKKKTRNHQATVKQLVWLHRPNSSVWSGSLIRSVDRVSIGSEKAPYTTMDPFCHWTTSPEQQREPEAALLQASVWEGLRATFTSRRAHCETSRWLERMSAGRPEY